MPIPWINLGGKINGPTSTAFFFSKQVVGPTPTVLFSKASKTIYRTYPSLGSSSTEFRASILGRKKKKERMLSGLFLEKHGCESKFQKLPRSP